MWNRDWTQRLFRKLYLMVTGRAHPREMRLGSRSELLDTFRWFDCAVSPREDGSRDRQTQEEWWCLRRYLLALAHHDRLTYPLTVIKGESPDFQLVAPDGSRTGVEVTQAAREPVMKRLNGLNRLEAVGLSRGRTGERGWVGDELEQDWCEAVARAIENKRATMEKAHWRRTERNVLIVYDHTFIPGVKLDRARSMLHAGSGHLLRQPLGDGRGVTFSLLKEDHLLYDLAQGWEMLPVFPDSL